MESELVSGFMTEHAAVVFVFFFLAEYGSIVLMCILNSLLFLGGYLSPVSIYHFFYYIQGIIYIIYYILLLILEPIFIFLDLYDNLYYYGIFNIFYECFFNFNIIVCNFDSSYFQLIEYFKYIMNNLELEVQTSLESILFAYPNLEGLLYGITLGLKSSIMIFTFV